MQKNTPKKNLLKPLIFLVVVTLIIILIRKYNLSRYFSLSFIQTQLNILQYQFSEHTLLFILGYFIIYVVSTALSIPGATVLTLLSGTIFGLVLGTAIVSFASTLGATCSFLVAKFFLRDTVAKRFETQFKKIDLGIKKDGAQYLFALRLVPLFPFFVINLAMGLTRLPLLTYVLVSQIGMLPGTIVYVNAGKALSTIESTAGIFSAKIWFAFALLALLPAISKKTLTIIKSRKIYKPFTRPKHYDSNVIVIGAGSGGLIASYIAATVGASVYLVEKQAMGGDCLNSGCVPSKTLLTASKYARMHTHANELGVKYFRPSITFSKVMKCVHAAIADIAPHDSIERYEALGVKCLQGSAKILSPWEVQVDEKIYTTKSIVIATGANPQIPEISGLDTKDVITSDTVWNLQRAPKNLVVVGGGPIGCELALAFSSLGVKVSIVQRATQLLPKEDEEVGVFAQKSLEAMGIAVYTSSVPKEVKSIKGSKTLCINSTEKSTKYLAFDTVLVAAGRQADTQSLGVDQINLELQANGTIAVDQYLRTNIPNIYAIGDVIGQYMFTHTAAHMAWYASINALFGRVKLLAVDYRVVPSITFLEPEFARVGITEKEAIAQNLDYEVTVYNMKEQNRAITEHKTEGFIKVITPKDSDKILGATVVAERGGEILGQFILAMKHKLGLNKILSTMYPYPSYNEAAKAVAGVWRKKHTPDRLLSLSKKLFHLALHQGAGHQEVSHQRINNQETTSQKKEATGQVHTSTPKQGTTSSKPK